MISVRDYAMNDSESFPNSTYKKQTHLAERELSSFVTAVTKLFGPDQARIPADDWLGRSDLIGSPPRSEARGGW